ncbi:MAG TPA: hypothetical protein VGM80_17245 [Gaiellaceae bacterium]|jgi:hypothetical protein
MSTAHHLHSHREPSAARRHLKVTGAGPAFGFEPCEDVGCTVGIGGIAESCGRQACPACGCGGTNLSTIELVDSLTRVRVRCTCGYSWLRSESLVYGLSHA